MTLIKYGCIFVSAGVFISGALLWDGSGDRRVMAESVAEIMAAQVERSEVAYLFGTNAVPDFSSNNVVSVRLEFATLYGAMEAARELAVDNTASVLWLDPNVTIADGATIAGCDAQWVATNIGGGDYTCTLILSNSASIYNSSGSRRADSSCIYMPDVDTNDVAPICSRFFPSVNLGTVAVFGEDFNWWQHIGISTNVYKYECEQWHNIDGTEIDVTFVGGAGFTNDASLHIPYPDLNGSFGIHSSNTNGAQLRAALFQVDEPTRGSAVFAVSDAAGASSDNIIFTAETVTVTEGGPETLGIHPGSNVGTIERITWSIIGTGIDTWPAYGTCGGFYWGGYNPAWNVSRVITIHALQDADSSDGAVVLRFQRSSQPGVYQYVAVQIVDDDEGDADIAVMPALSVINKEQTAVVSVEIAAATNMYYWTDKRIAATNLFEAKAVLESLARSVVFYDADDLDYDAWVRYRYTGFTNEYESGDSSVYGTFGFGSTLTAYNGLSTPLTTTYTNGGGYYGGIMQITADISVGNSRIDSFDYGTSSYSASADYDLYEVSGCSLEYPSLYAITNGYVKRVRVYICVSAARGNRTTIPMYWDSDVLSFSGYSHQPWFYEQFNYGNALYLDLCSRDDGGQGFPPNGIETPAYNFSISGLRAYKLIKVGDETNPTELVKFDIGGKLADYNFAMGGKSDFESYELVSTALDGDVTSEVGYFEHNNSLRIEKIVVVVDWSWQHCNDAVPFVPQNNTPAWAE